MPAKRRLDRRLTDRRALPGNHDQTHAIRDRIAQFKAALAYLGVTQRRAALNARVAETRFSDIMRGRVTPTPKEQQRISKALHRSKDILFGNTAGVH